ncbi:rod shape-determining protein MreC [Niallia taxi]|nr:rod shape-determining protein MreC [Niallia taxi]MDE5052251.1 rod shape-determining protein MreC [Niallia taxi]
MIRSWVKATIVSMDLTRLNELTTLNMGNNDGVEKDMAVIASAGLIGKVESVSTGASAVQQLSSEKSNKQDIRLYSHG